MHGGLITVPKQPQIAFDQRNLQKGEEILFKFKPDHAKFMTKVWLTGGGMIPLPFALLWGIIDLGIVFGAPLGTGQTILLAFLIPFMAIHMAPVWIYIYGVVQGRKDYKNCGHMLTTQRLITRSSRKGSFVDFNIADITSIMILTNSSLEIRGKTGLTLHTLKKADMDKLVDLFFELKEKLQKKELNKRFKSLCKQCGGKVTDGVCEYCGSTGISNPEKKT